MSTRNHVKIRHATALDEGEVSALLAAAGLVGLGVTAQFGPQYSVATDKAGRILGVAGLEIYDTDALLRSVAVGSQFQSQGIGRALAQNRLEWAQEVGIQDVYLLTTTATSYWERMGFATIQRESAPAAIKNTSEWREACPSTATVMRLSLQGKLR